MPDLNLEIDIDLPSLEELFNSPIAASCESYLVRAIDAERGGLIGEFYEPNPDVLQIAWAAQSEVIEIDHEAKTATVSIWYNLPDKGSEPIDLSS